MIFTKKMLLDMGFHEVETKLQNMSIVRMCFGFRGYFTVGFTTSNRLNSNEIEFNLIQKGNLTLNDLINEIAEVQFNNGVEYEQDHSWDN